MNLVTTLLRNVQHCKARGSLTVFIVKTRFFASLRMTEKRSVEVWIFYVYIMSSEARTLYIGMTNNLERRVDEHKRQATPSFTSRYKVNRLVYYETFQYVYDAIAREKQLKGWARAKKIALIEQENPRWLDLSKEWS